MKQITLYEKLSLIRDWQYLTVEDIAKTTFEPVSYVTSFESGDYKAISADVATKSLIARLARAYRIEAAFLDFLVEEEYALRVSAASPNNPSVKAQAIIAEAEILPMQARRFFDHKNFVVLDTETTGKDANSCEIVEIAIVAHDGTVLLNSLVRPSQPIPSEATAIHGITDEMVKDAPTFPEVFPKIDHIIRDKMTIVYNVSFDITLLHQLCLRYDLGLTVTAWCLMEAYVNFYKAPDKYGRPCCYAWQSLTKACEQQGVVLEEAHRALGDTLATLGLLKALASKEE